jgi:tetratricopeptide (TPR) repeat protein
MLCPDCGYEVPEPLTLCPRCGQNVEQTQPIRRRKTRRAAAIDETLPLPIPALQQEAEAEEEEQEETPRSALWKRVRVVLLAFAAFLCLLALSSGAGVYLGVRHGEATRVAEQLNLADEHYRRGLARLDNGEFELAIAEFEYALELDPQHGLAAQGVAEAEARIAARPTPTTEPEVDVREELYADGEAAYTARDWDRTVDLLAQLRAFDPEYERESVEDMLFESLNNEGLNLLEEGRLEEGIFYLDQAQEIRDLDEAVLLELELARRYLRALGFWGVDWNECIRQFEDLYALAPGYRDVLSRLFEAHVLYGEWWAEQGEMCPAAARYARALELMNDPEVAEKRDAAASVCAVATPTPVPPITGTLITTGTVQVPGFQVGRLAYPAYNSQTGVYDIYALTADGRLMQMAIGADQPSWQWGTDRLIYRNRLSPGIFTLQPGSQPVMLREGSNAAAPTFSPDGGRYAYTAPGENGYSHIFIARTDGVGEPIDHAPGWDAAWGPTGILAWTGCASGSSDCGIFVDNPDDDQPPRRLTSDINDSNVHWSPGGDRLAYSSNHMGSWDIYLLDLSAEVQLLVDDSTVEALPAWAPDGSGLAFLSYRDGLWGIYLVQLDGQNVRKIIDLGPEMPGWENQRLSWSP